jgi:hypothetical protein
MDYEDVTAFTLSDPRRDLLFRTQRECTFVWGSSAGQPVGVTMSYLWRDGAFWLASTSARKRTIAVLRDPRVSIVVSSAGTDLGPGKTITYVGICEKLDGADVVKWYLNELADDVLGDNHGAKAGFIASMATPRRVVLKVSPVRVVNSYDGDAVRDAAAAERGPTRIVTPDMGAE